MASSCVVALGLCTAELVFIRDEIAGISVDDTPARKQQKLRNKPRVTVIFDGGSARAEAEVIVIRWVDAELNIHHRVAGVELLRKSPDASELRETVLQALRGAQLSVDNVFSVSHDRASTNFAAVRDWVQQKVTPGLVAWM